MIILKGKIMGDSARGKTVVLFDGYCNLCCGFANWVIRHDRSAKILLAPLQGETADKAMAEMGFGSPPSDSIILLHDDKKYFRSDAVLVILRLLGPPWSWLNLIVLIPRPVRDFFYQLVARSRYRLFGKCEECGVLKSDERGRMLP